MNCSAVDFFVGVGQMKKSRKIFDLVILDPPYFSLTERGRVDLVNDVGRLVNKVRPLVSDGGKLVVVNNALYLSGQAFLQAIEELGKDGYITVETMIPVPEDFTGYPATRKGHLPADPAPFNHSTKIVILKIKRKEGIAQKPGAI
jgi:23S rRNA (cytosine1962-C5)-methyltransferase